MRSPTGLQPVPRRRDHVAVLHRGKERQCNGRSSDALGMREVAFAETHRPIQREQVQRGIMHADADALFLHRRDELAAIGAGRQQDLEHVPVAVAEIGHRQSQSERRIDAGKIAPGQFAPAGGEAGELLHLAEADGGGDVGQVELAAQHIDVHAAVGEALYALQAQPLAEAGIDVSRQHQGAALGGGQVLVGVEAEGDEVSGAADAVAVP
jgi:hypothetical protein